MSDVSLYISGFSALLSLSVAVYNVYDKQIGKKQERRAKAPYLMANLLPVAVGPENGQYRFDIAIKNCGNNPAVNICGSTIMVLDLTQKTPGGRVSVPKLPFTNANGLPGGVEYTVSFPLKLAHVPPQHVRVELSYTDALDGSRHKMRYGYYWGGSDETGAIRPLSREELEPLNTFLDDTNVHIS